MADTVAVTRRRRRCSLHHIQRDNRQRDPDHVPAARGEVRSWSADVPCTMPPSFAADRCVCPDSPGTLPSTARLRPAEGLAITSAVNRPSGRTSTTVRQTPVDRDRVAVAHVGGDDRTATVNRAGREVLADDHTQFLHDSGEHGPGPFAPRGNAAAGLLLKFPTRR